MRPLRIDSCELYVVKAGLRDWLFVRLQSDVPGLDGWGEATLNWRTESVAAVLRELSPLLPELDGRRVNHSLNLLRRRSYYRLGIIGETALSAIEHALFDMHGKELGIPVYELLGGRIRDSLPVYGHLGGGRQEAVYGAKSGDSIGEELLSLRDRGYRAAKIVPLPSLGTLVEADVIAHLDRIMSVSRGAVGDDFEIMVDLHGRPRSLDVAARILDVLGPYRPLFVEEPLAPALTRGYGRLSRCGVPIATGERLIGAEEFSNLALGEISFLQPDLNHCGGLGVGLEVATLAKLHGAALAPHNPNGPLASAAAAHFGFAVEGVAIQEEMSDAGMPFTDVCSLPFDRVGSEWRMSERPGLGIEMDMGVLEKFELGSIKPTYPRGTAPDGSVAAW